MPPKRHMAGGDANHQDEDVHSSSPAFFKADASLKKHLIETSEPCQGLHTMSTSSPLASRPAEGTVYGMQYMQASSECLRAMEAIATKCKKSKKPFLDVSFLSDEDDATPSSKSSKPTHYGRLGGLLPGVPVFSSNTEACDLKQGDGLKDTAFLGALASLASSSAQHLNPIGRLIVASRQDIAAYGVVLYYHCRWEWVIVDDVVPCNEEGVLFHASTVDEPALWPMLIEKAVAKRFGSYDAMERMSDSGSFLVTLTGGLLRQVDLSSGAWSPKTFVQLFRNQNVIVCCRSTKDEMPLEEDAAEGNEDQKEKQAEEEEEEEEEKEGENNKIDESNEETSKNGESKEADENASPAQATGILKHLPYSVTDARVMPRGGVGFIRVRNPWGCGAEWKGRFSDGSPDWEEHPEYKKVLKPEFKDDGAFWMLWEDFIAYFPIVDVCEDVEANSYLILQHQETPLASIELPTPKSSAEKKSKDPADVPSTESHMFVLRVGGDDASTANDGTEDDNGVIVVSMGKRNNSKNLSANNPTIVISLTQVVAPGSESLIGFAVTPLNGDPAKPNTLLTKSAEVWSALAKAKSNAFVCNARAASQVDDEFPLSPGWYCVIVLVSLPEKKTTSSKKKEEGRESGGYCLRVVAPTKMPLSCFRLDDEARTTTIVQVGTDFRRPRSDNTDDDSSQPAGNGAPPNRGSSVKPVDSGKGNVVIVVKPLEPKPPERPLPASGGIRPGGCIVVVSDEPVVVPPARDAADEIPPAQASAKDEDVVGEPDAAVEDGGTHPSPQPPSVDVDVPDAHDAHNHHHPSTSNDTHVEEAPPSQNPSDFVPSPDDRIVRGNGPEHLYRQPRCKPPMMSFAMTTTTTGDATMSTIRLMSARDPVVSTLGKIFDSKAAECAATVRRIVDLCKHQSKTPSGTGTMPFFDKTFYYGERRNLYPNGTPDDCTVSEPLAVERLSKKFPKWPLFNGKSKATDICQGGIGNCFLIGALAAIAANGPAEEVDPLQRLFPAYDQEAGVYGVMFFKNGGWEWVIVDDLVAVSPDDSGAPLFASSPHEELWPLILEKAFAKMHRCWDTIDGGMTKEALADMTGGDVSSVETKTFTLDSFVEYFNDPYTIVGCSVDPKAEESEGTGKCGEQNAVYGLIKGHAYSVINAKKTSDGCGFVQVRNPWGNDAEWKGAYSDNDDAWKKHKLHFEEVAPVFEPDGAFWMSWDDFSTYFPDLQLCKWHPRLTKALFTYAMYKPQRSNKNRIQDLPPEQVFIVKVMNKKDAHQTTTTANIAVTLGQEDIKLDVDHDHRKHGEYAALHFDIHKLSACPKTTQELRVHTTGDRVDTGNVLYEDRQLDGTYPLHVDQPYAIPCTIEATKPLGFFLRLLCPQNVDVEVYSLANVLHIATTVDVDCNDDATGENVVPPPVSANAAPFVRGKRSIA